MVTDSLAPLKIAILVRRFPNIVQTYVLNHILSLKKAGAETRIIARENPKQQEIHPHIQENNILDETLYISTDIDQLYEQLLATPFTNPLYLSVINKIIYSNIWKQRGFKYGIKALVRARALSLNSFDIAHSHSLFSSYDYLFLKDIFSTPIITTFHGLLPKNVKKLEFGKIKAVLDTGDAFFVNTNFAQKQLVDLGCHPGKIHIIPQGTNMSDFPFKARTISHEKTINILSVGRLSIEKGFHVAVKAIAHLVEHYPNIKYRIIGGGPEEQYLTELIHNLNLHESVKIYGSVSTDELLSHYSDAHIFILPSIDFRDGSHTETQGVVLQEAQSSGIPVIASRTGGIPEVIKDGVTGLLFDEENDVQLSQLLESLMNDNELYQSLSLQAKKDVEDNFSAEVICNRQLEVYKRLLQNI